MFTEQDEKYGRLTTQMRSLYTDYKLISTEDPEKLGYLTFEAKSNLDHRCYEVRAFNSNSVHARADMNRAKTLFVKEAMRLMSQVPESIDLDSIEIEDNKICYALNSGNTPQLDEENYSLSSRFDLSRFLQDILEDLKYLSPNRLQHGWQRYSISANRIYQIGDRYFLRDWNYISQLEASNEKKKEPTNSLHSNTEEDNIYELGLAVLELNGEKSEEIKSIKSTKFYEKNIESLIFENKSLAINLTLEQKKLLLRMLDKDPENRPKFTKLLKETHGNGASFDQTQMKSNKMTNLGVIKKENSSKKQENQLFQDEEQLNLTHSILLSNGEFAELHKQLKEIQNPLELNEINVTGCNIGHEGAIYLGENNSWKNLKSLNLRGNLIRDRGAAALGKNKSWTNLITVELWGNAITAEGINSFSNNDSWINLKLLSLRDNKIGSEGAKILSKNTSWIKLTTLNLQENLIGVEGAIALSKNVSWTKLKTLDLGNNSIGAEGAAALSKNSKWTKLTTLLLQNNGIGTQGAILLGKNSVWIELKDLDLMNNKISEEGLKALYNNKTWKNLKTLKFQGNEIASETQKRFEQNKLNIKLFV